MGSVQFGIQLNQDVSSLKNIRLCTLFYVILKNILFTFRERGREGEKGNTHQCAVASPAAPTGDSAATQACALTGIQTGDPWLRRLVAHTQSTEPHQPGQII